MKLRHVFYAVAGLTGAAFIGEWWDYHGGQTWLAVHTGTDYCVNVPHSLITVCRAYGWWSGFGSVFPWVLIGSGGVIGVLILHWRHVNCHKPGCWRVGKYPLAGGEFKVCGLHQPDWKGKHPPEGHIKDAHERWKLRHGKP